LKRYDPNGERENFWADFSRILEKTEKKKDDPIENYKLANP
jgi:hypothetical protein